MKRGQGFDFDNDLLDE
jgi:hypothetical protein